MWVVIGVMLTVVLNTGEVQQQLFPNWSECSQFKNSIERNSAVDNAECREVTQFVRR
jgi:hypothetical protein